MSFDYSNFIQKAHFVMHPIKQKNEADDSTLSDAEPSQNKNETTNNATTENTYFFEISNILSNYNLASIIQNFEMPNNPTLEPIEEDNPIDNSNSDVEIKELKPTESHEPKETPKEELAKRISHDFATEIGFSDDEIEEFFDYKTITIDNGDNSSIGRCYVLKDDININGKDVKSVKDLVVALDKQDYFNNKIEELAEKYSNGNEKLKAELIQRANNFFENYNDRLDFFEIDLMRDLKDYTANWDEYKGDYSEYKLTDYNDFEKRFESGKMSFEDAINILTSAGAKITYSTDEKDKTYGTSRSEKIIYEIDGQEYSVFRVVKPEVINNSTNVNDETKNIAENFANGSLSIDDAIKKLKELGVENIMHYESCNIGINGIRNFRCVCFDLNGTFYRIESDKAEPRKENIILKKTD